MVALLVPACGGGGEGQDYYVSVRQFENASKGFHIVATPPLEVRGRDYIGNKQHTLSEQFLQALLRNGGEGGGGGEGLPPDDADGGTLVEGVSSCAGSPTACDIAYYVKGGETGAGYMYITFRTNDGNAPRLIANVMGCILPDQYIQVTENWTISVDRDQKVLVNVTGAVLRITFDFTTGFAHLALEYSYRDGVDDEPFPVEADRPFIAIDL